MARAQRNVETLIPAECTRREVCTFAVSSNREPQMAGDKRGSSGIILMHRAACIEQTSCVTRQLVFIVIIWLRVARNYAAKSRSTEAQQILLKESENWLPASTNGTSLIARNN